jgi:hypothetical protein
MKRLLLWTIGLLTLVIVLAFAYFHIKSEPLPSSQVNGDELAKRMLLAVDKPAFDSIKFLSWNFNNTNEYIWNKTDNKVVVKTKEVTTFLDLNSITGKAYKEGNLLTGDASAKAINRAWSSWCNDSFWALGHFKLFDPGTTRKEINLLNGQTGLLVSYQSGGVTPGDSYLWILNENKIPTGFKLWVKMLPIKGLLASWDNWTTTQSNAKFSQSHKISFYTSKVTNFKEGNSWEDFGYNSVSF